MCETRARCLRLGRSVSEPKLIMKLCGDIRKMRISLSVHVNHLLRDTDNSNVSLGLSQRLYFKDAKSFVPIS